MFNKPIAIWHKNIGWTLPELLVVTAIVGLLSAIAVPVYHQQLSRARRVQPRAALQLAALWMERAALSNGRYPSELAQGLKQLTGGHYTIGLENPDPARASENLQSYLLTARRDPQGKQANDPCGNFTLDSTGQRGLTDPLANMTVESCWGRQMAPIHVKSRAGKNLSLIHI